MRLKSTDRLCYVCGEIKPMANFYPSINPHHFGKKTPICKECADVLYNEYFNKTQRYDAAVWCTLADMGLPFIDDVWQEVLDSYEKRAEQMKGRTPIGYYIKCLNEHLNVVEGFWQSDKMLNSFMDIGSGESGETDVDLDNRRKRQRDDWGEFDDDDLDYLDKQFTEYTANLSGMDKITTMRYRDLCKAELAKRKADESGDNADIKNAKANLFDIMKLLKLDNFQGNERSDEEKRIEHMAYVIEHTKPAECEDLDKYRDFSGFDKNWKTIMRCVLNACAGTRNYPSLPKSER